MVLKSSKNGVYSGNTLRASNSRYNRLYRTHGCIVRRFVRNAETLATLRKPLLDSFDIAAYNVEFSLNKKERWDLPDFIRKHIQDDGVQDVVTKTDLVVRHKLKRQANCVAYYANKGHLKRLVPKCGRYFDGKSATNFRLRPKRTGNRRAEPENEETKVIPMYTIRYEVFLPCSRFSSLTHNPKYIKPEYEEEESTSFGGGRRKKKRTRLTSRDIDEMLEFSDPREDDIRQCEKTPSEVCTEAADIHMRNFTLRDFLKPQRKPKRKSHRRSRRESDESECKKTKVFYVEESENKISTESTIPKAVQGPYLKDPTSLCPVAVKLDHEEVAFDSLQTAYGQQYVEARCEPRKFSIDITDEVRDHFKSSKLFRDITPSSLDLTCYLNFAELGSSSDDASLIVYNVALNLASHMNSIKLENILEMETYSINELVAKSMSYIDILPRDVFVNCDIRDRLSQPVMAFELVGKAMKWNVNCVHPQESFSDVPKVTETNAEAVNCEIPSEFCNICYDEIKTDIRVDDVRAPATCLDACGHWFCDRCWRDHLISRLRSGAIQLTCPEYECNSTVDFPTLLSFLHIGDIKKHMARQENEKINSSPQAIWCPMPQCGRAIWAEGTDRMPKNAICKCGVDLCCACKKNAHWPATCEQAKQFREKVIALNDFMDLPKHVFIDPLPDAILVKGKSCPKCLRFIEKISGCPNMTCPCGATFCWTCVQVITPYSPHDCFDKSQREVVLGSESQSDICNMKRTRFYTTALEHCKLRLYPNFCKFRSRAFGMSKCLAMMISKDKKIQQHVSNLLDADSKHLQSKICKFLMRMLSMKLEIHHVIEHVAIAIDSLSPGNLRVKLQHVLSRMESYALTIASILEKGTHQNLHGVLAELQLVETNAQRTIRNLSRLLSTLVKY